MKNPTIDSHHHFWRIDRGVNGWITDDISAIRRDYLPAHLAPYLAHLGIDATVLVQASETWEENAFMVAEAEASGFVGAVVAWADLTDPAAGERLQELARHGVVKGIRPVLQGIDDSEWVLRPDVMGALAVLAPLGLAFDALVQPRHLPAIDALARALPDLPIVIDHAAKPPIRAGAPPPLSWAADMARLARHPQVCCKLSGLATEHGPGWRTETLAPVADRLLETFGPARLMWGSDWPVLELDGSYPQWLACARDLTARCGAGERADIMGGTAQRFYGIEIA